jgi:zinc transporter, ZIP family
LDPTVATVALAALVTALATGLGALPFLFVHSTSTRAVGLSSAAAAGFMTAATVVLAFEGGRAGIGRAALGVVLGALALRIIQGVVRDHHDLHVGLLRGADAARAVTIVVVMTAHSFAEGVGIGVSFADGAALGLFITIAIAVHNVPEGLAISTVLVPRGSGVPAAAGWSIVSSLPQPLMAVPAFLFVEAFEPLLALGLGFAAGAMAWMVATELLPDARKRVAFRPLATAFGLAFAGMMAFQLALAAA